MKCVSSLISGVGIFCVGTGLSVYHGIHGLLLPTPVETFYWAYFILAISLVSEGGTLIFAIQSIEKAAQEKRKTFKDYVLSGQDPSVNVVLMEDLAAVFGVTFAATCMGLTLYLGNPMFDAIGSLLVGGLLGGVASFIIYTNVAALIGRSMSQENLDKINAQLESDIMVRFSDALDLHTRSTTFEIKICHTHTHTRSKTLEIRRFSCTRGQKGRAVALRLVQTLKKDPSQRGPLDLMKTKMQNIKKVCFCTKLFKSTIFTMYE